MTDNRSSVERAQTDTSLRSERKNVDDAMRAEQSQAEGGADRIVQRARETADAVLLEARERADDRLEQPAASVVIAQERAVEDETVRAERARADEQLRREREELGRLLPLEREATDRHLLTERARSDESLSQRDDFLGIVSHDLRNLLSGIVMTSTLLAERAATSDDGVQAVAAAHRIQHYAARMNRLIGDLVDVASIEAGKLSIAPTRGDACALVDEAVGMFETLAHSKGLSLASRMGHRPLPATFDHDRMIQVLANLITNAIKFTAAGGTIVVEAGSANGGTQISVRDSGIGIPSDKLDAVFERFWQGGKSDRRGVGLGLYIARCIVQAHGGTIRVESVPGAGTTMSFTLPA